MINKVEWMTVKNVKETSGQPSTLSRLKGVDLSYFFISIMTFLVSRAVIMDNITPFGITFLAVLMKMRKEKILIPFLISGFSLFTVHGVDSYKYLIPLGIIFLCQNNLKKKGNIATAAILATILFITKASYIIFSKVYVYDLVIAFFESIIIFSLTYVFLYNLPSVQKSYDRKLSTEEMISCSIILSLALLGIGSSTFMGVSIKYIFSILTILLVSYNIGMSYGTVIGVSIGMVLSLSTMNTPYIIAIFSISSLLTGLFKDLGKFLGGVGFFIGNSLISYYANGLSEPIIGYKEIGLALILFIVLNKKFSESLDKLWSTHKEVVNCPSESYDNYDIRNRTCDRLKDISTVFEELAATFMQVVRQERPSNQKDISKFAEAMIDGICKECPMYRFCWENDFYNTYNSMFELINTIEVKGKLTEDLMPNNLKKRCIKSKDILNKADYLFEIYKSNHKCKKIIAENRQLIAQQLEGVSQIISTLSEDISKDVKIKRNVEEDIWTNLINQNIEVKKVLVTEYEDGEFEIYLEIANNDMSTLIEKKVISTVSKVVGMELKRDDFFDDGSIRNRVKFKLIKTNKFEAITKVAKYESSMDAISGDSFTFGEKDNKYYVALSDGMGIGKRANRESEVTISILEKLLQAGYDKELALKTINSILVLKSEDEMSSTIDVSHIDLYTGRTQFIKAGSAPTFIKRDDTVEVINSNSLPAGILKEVDFNVYEKDLKNGDLIIMVSDGVLDANKDIDDKEKWLCESINNMGTVNPQKLANYILDLALDVATDEDIDDMTVLVTKVWKGL
ncbi:stage II sporulation protein E [Clostridiisalibacter paucivorans]|uniref:stage II sporulation protein E n=1 Tax=Clostridiisalibacter paucivorans TaxID=408753 RepID=UPI00047BDE02|nr:stage II sporulation protein E [Clostridiisalibacter paucivorans]